jgi:hypothetical protein
MPKVYRSMKKADDGKPVVDVSGKGLGVRGTPVIGVVDVDLDHSGNVILNGKGLSVAPAWRGLPYFLVSKRLQAAFPGARGSRDLFVLRLGTPPLPMGQLLPDSS